MPIFSPVFRGISVVRNHGNVYVSIVYISVVMIPNSFVYEYRNLEKVILDKKLYLVYFETQQNSVYPD